MELSGTQLRELQNKLLDLYPTWTDLKQMVAYDLNQNLEVIATVAQSNNLTEVIFNLIEWARAHGQLDELQAASLWTRPVCPYPGMVPFNEKEAALFYGRSEEIEQMLAYLRVERKLFVIGPSGSGKSSLIFAGLLPQLQRSSYWPPHTWLVRVMSPGAQPRQTLAAQLEGDPMNLPLTLDTLLAAHPPATQLLLVIDQLEEIFTQTKREAQTTFLTDVQALMHNERCTVIFTMRADFYPDLMDSVLWPLDKRQRMEVARLQGSALRAAIERPAAAARVELQAGLLERLLADASDEPGVLPMLQETMVLLWSKLQRRVVPLAAYESLGKDQRSGLAVAMSIRADAALADLPPPQQAIARRIFLRLVQFGEGRPDTRRRQPVVDLRSEDDDPAVFETTLKYLADQRLLTLSAEEKDGTRQADIAHEALIAGWPLLSVWLIERRDAEHIRRRLVMKANEWTRLGQATGGLLDAVELREAEEWLARPDAAELGYDATLLTLIKQSGVAITQASAEKETARQRELTQAREVAEMAALAAEKEGQRADAAALAAEKEGQRADAQSQARRQLLVGVIALIVLLLFAASQWQTAAAARNSSELARQTAVAAGEETSRQLRVTRAQELAAQASAQLDQDPELSLLLGMEAVSTTQRLNELVVPQAEDVLHQALLRSHVRRRLEAGNTPLYNVALSPDGHTCAAAGMDGTIHIWDLDTGQELRVLRGHQGPVLAVAYSPDARHLVSAGDDSTARIWNAATGELEKILRGHNNRLWSAAWSPSGRFIVTASRDNTVRIWNMTTGEQQQQFEAVVPRGVMPGLHNAEFSPDGRYIVTSGNDHVIRIWDAATGQEWKALMGHTDWVFHATWSPDGTRIASAGADGTVRIWDVAAGKEQFTLRGHIQQVLNVSWSADGRYLVSAGWDNSVRLWDATTGLAGPILNGHTNRVFGLTWTQNSFELLTASLDGTVRLWDIRPPVEQVPRLQGPGRATGAVYSPDNHYILAGSDEGKTYLWDTIRSQVERTFDTPSGAKITSIAYSRDGQHILTAGLDGRARIWSVTDGSILQTLTGHTMGVESAAWSPDEQRVVTAGDDGQIKVWDSTTGTTIWTSPETGGHQSIVYSANYRPDGHTIVSASADGTAKIWEATTGALRQTLAGDPNGLYYAVYSPDGKRIATAGLAGQVTIWYNATTDGAMKEGIVLRGHTAAVYRVAFSPDGKRLLTASADRTVRIWDVESGQLYTTFHDYQNEVLGVSYSPDGQRIVTADADGIVHQYVAAVPALLPLAITRITRNFTAAEQRTYFGALPGNHPEVGSPTLVPVIIPAPEP